MCVGFGLIEFDLWKWENAYLTCINASPKFANPVKSLITWGKLLSISLNSLNFWAFKFILSNEIASKIDCTIKVYENHVKKL